MPPAELRALLLLLALAVAGQAVRHLITRPDEPPGGIQLLGALSRGSPTAQRDSAMRQGRPLAAGERIDVDSAGAAELARLPRVGPRLAKVIVADRQAHGPFGSLGALDRVSGIGPGLLKLVEPHVKFSGAAGQWGSGAVDLHGCASSSRPSVPPPHCPAAPLNINSASERDLDALPGIGPAKARAIFRYREEHGPFIAVKDLAEVPGLSPAVVDKLKESLTLH